MLLHVLIARGALYLFRSHGIRSEILVKRVTGRIQKKSRDGFFYIKPGMSWEEIPLNIQVFTAFISQKKSENCISAFSSALLTIYPLKRELRQLAAGKVGSGLLWAEEWELLSEDS